MITIGYCTRKSDDNHKKHLIKTCGLGDKKVQVIEIVNEGDRSLTECYNEILNKSSNDIVVFCHSDITIETKQWGNKLTKLFNKNPDYGIIGVAGSKKLNETGKWWDIPKSMVGRVSHTHEGKTWLSSYSEDQGTDIEETVIVDGVFFAINKKLIKKDFNEGVTGFHFYDVTFCFENYLAGVKIGVVTNIRIDHKSIGQTNEQWETNRQLFAENFKDSLPVTIKKVIRPNQKLKVLIGCLNFNSYTGSELYVFELGKELIKKGCEVSICSTLGNPLANMAKQIGIRLYDLKNPPGFKLGDGKWLLKTPEGEVPSQPETLYKVGGDNFDVLHLNHKPVTEHLMRLYPDVPIVCSIGSKSVTEEPIFSQQIKKYIAIDSEIKDYIVNGFGIDTKLVNVINTSLDNKKIIQDNIVDELIEKYKEVIC